MGRSSGVLGCHVIEAWGERWTKDAAPMPGSGDGKHQLIVGCSTGVTEVVRSGKTTLFVMPCGIADGRGHTAVRRQLHGEIGVCSGTVGRGRGDQSGDGGLDKLDGTTSRGIVCVGVRGSLRVCMRL